MDDLINSRREQLTINRHAGLVDESVALEDAIGKDRLAPGDVDGGGGELAEVDETGSAGS